MGISGDEDGDEVGEGGPRVEGGTKACVGDANVTGGFEFNDVGLRGGDDILAKEPAVFCTESRLGDVGGVGAGFDGTEGRPFETLSPFSFKARTRSAMLFGASLASLDLRMGESGDGYTANGAR